MKKFSVFSHCILIRGEIRIAKASLNYLMRREHIRKPFGAEEYHGRNEIKAYWEEHHVNSQTNPAPKLINSAFGNNVCSLEWELDIGLRVI